MVWKKKLVYEEGVLFSKSFEPTVNGLCKMDVQDEVDVPESYSGSLLGEVCWWESAVCLYLFGFAIGSNN